MINLTGGDGSTQEKAIIILNARDGSEGVKAEYSYVENILGKENVRWTLAFQNFIGDEDKQYDVLHIDLVDGGEKEFWFDITDFFGK